MTLEQWISKERAQLQAFAEYWRKEQKGPDGEGFPEDLPPEDWDEQYHSFIG
jgi:hypothetical protein